MATKRNFSLWRALAVQAASIFVFIGLGCGSSTVAKLSEGSDQVGHAASLEMRRPVHPVTSNCTGSRVTLGSARATYAAVVRRSAVARRSPGAGAIVATFGRLDVNRFPTVFAVLAARMSGDCKPAWYRVQLSVLPNGTSGWVSASSIRLFRVDSRIEVSLSKRRLNVYRAGKLVLSTLVGIGAAATPTPVGRFYVNERFVLSSGNGPFGPNALGISAHSNALASTWVENGPIGIHGTNEPWTIGQAASHGCIRVPNEIMRRVFAFSAAGVPVIIRA